MLDEHLYYDELEKEEFKREMEANLKNEEIPIIKPEDLKSPTEISSSIRKFEIRAFLKIVIPVFVAGIISPALVPVLAPTNVVAGSLLVLGGLGVSGIIGYVISKKDRKKIKELKDEYSERMIDMKISMIQLDERVAKAKEKKAKALEDEIKSADISKEYDNLPKEEFLEKMNQYNEKVHELTTISPDLAQNIVYADDSNISQEELEQAKQLVKKPKKNKE